MNNTKIVDFTLCKMCRFFETNEAEEPCHECLHVPSRDDGSRRPVRYWPKTEDVTAVSSQ